MRFVPQSVQKENVQAFQLTKRSFRNFAVVSKISRVAEAKAVNLRLSVNQSHRLEARPKKLHGTVNRPQLELRQAAIFVISVKDVAERTEVIDTKNMVGVRMSIENCIHLRDSLPDGLCVEIRRGVNKHNLARILDHDGRSGTAVMRITGMADHAVAAQRRYTHGRAAAQYRERGLHRLTFMFGLPWLGRHDSMVTVLRFLWQVQAAADATARRSLPHRPSALHRGCSAESFLPWV